MYLFTKKTRNTNLIIACNGLGENAFVFYNQFWGIVGKADAIKKDEHCFEIKLRLGAQLSYSSAQSIIKNYWGYSNIYDFTIEKLGSDDIGYNAKLELYKR